MHLTKRELNVVISAHEAYLCHFVGEHIAIGIAVAWVRLARIDLTVFVGVFHAVRQAVAVGVCPLWVGHAVWIKVTCSTHLDPVSEAGRVGPLRGYNCTAHSKGQAVAAHTGQERQNGHKVGRPW